MARKGWDALSTAYKKRIEKAGLTRQDYEAGTSLTKARGHANTPENPRNFDPQKYPKYAAERTRLVQQVQQRKAQIFGGSERWNAKKSQKHFQDKPPTVAQLRWALEASDEDILDAIRESSETYHFLGYH